MIPVFDVLNILSCKKNLDILVFLTTPMTIEFSFKVSEEGIHTFRWSRYNSKQNNFGFIKEFFSEILCRISDIYDIGISSGSKKQKPEHIINPSENKYF